MLEQYITMYIILYPKLPKMHNLTVWYIILTTVEILQEFLFVSNLDLNIIEQ